jgi:hypothetical protein
VAVSVELKPGHTDVDEAVMLKLHCADIVCMQARSTPQEKILIDFIEGELQVEYRQFSCHNTLVFQADSIRN